MQTWTAINIRNENFIRLVQSSYEKSSVSTSGPTVYAMRKMALYQEHQTLQDARKATAMEAIT